MDFKESPFMYAMAAFIILFVVVESVFFMVKASKRAKELGISKETIKDTIISAALFTIAPAISILATVLVLASALGIVLPWIRLSVIGNLAYETVAASTMLEQFGSNINIEVTDPTQFAAVMWVMTVGKASHFFSSPFSASLFRKKSADLCQRVRKTQSLPTTFRRRHLSEL